MKKNAFKLFGLFVLCCIIATLFFRVHFLEEKQKAFASLPANTLQVPQGNLEKVGSSDYIQGNKDAKVTLIEYSDFECPSCQMMHPLFEKILQQFGNNIRFVQRMFPLPQNKNAEKEAEAVLCAGKIGGEEKYWEYGNSIFKRTTGKIGGEGFDLGKLVPLAKEFGMSENNFRQCLDSGEMEKEVQREQLSGENAGVNQLPALFITDKANRTTLLTGEQSLATLSVILSYTTQE